ncbi:MAG: TonB-dependent receptor [Bacillati bacterium ANGP1]|uniref:TonB-dependent receptor n=1 Tax=Candidatus Segetimicrobium genomatis TaxID=2569760 RepID=A0A537KEX1_9BACT|nr:MAG: TonB-dependent receptor [Terrabacteria group bacterium ANGP1]
MPSPFARSRQIMLAVETALAGAAAGAALAQQAPPAQPAQPPQLQEVVVTGSRILQNVAQSTQPLSVISSDQIEKTGLASVGDLLQQLTTGGKALNQKFNSSGNFGYPPDGGGIGAGSSQVDLRNLDSKRTLVMVDGLRWVNESSASGVSGSADLNTIPLAIIDHIEVLEDGASSIYGSDAIAGVVNIITRKKFEGIEANAYTGDFSKGGRTTEASLSAGGSSGKFTGVFVASFYNQDQISSGKWGQSAFPEPNAGLAAGSSGTPQGRFRFCDPSLPAGSYGACGTSNFNVTLDNGTTAPVWSNMWPANATSNGTYHHFTNADRFNYAPYNLLLTPSQRKALWTGLTYDASDDVQLYAKGLFNTRSSTNQAAPEPIFVGPVAGTGGIADSINVSHLNPFNPFGIDLCAVASPTCGNGTANFVGVTRRPLEGGPRIFDQDVDTWYFSVGFKGTLHLLDGFSWDVNYVDTDNKATQQFTGGYNVAKLGIALGDPAICAKVPGCTPLDLFGGQGRPITQQMLNYILAPQLDASDQKLKLLSANITGTIFHIQDRAAGIAVGAEHRLYDGIFNPDPLRQTGESQDSLAFPVSSSYHVNEAYAEFSVPILKSLGASAAVRYSDYSTFGNTTTYKGGLRWQPVEDVAVRGTYSTGFRAPNLGELYGLTQFGATLVDPCGPTGGTVQAQFVAGCRAQGVVVGPGFVQANTQITTFTGGNASLRPEKSDSYTAGIVYRPSWLAGRAGTDHLNLEATYYNHKIKGAIQAEDIQALLKACLLAGGTDPALCAPFSRIPNPAGGLGDLRPPKNFLQNLAQITTSGVDVKLTWLSEPVSFGHLSAALQATRVNDYSAVDTLGLVAQRTVGVEVDNSAIPPWRANAQLGWGAGGWEASWNLRFLSAVTELCSNASLTPVPGCSDAPGATHNLHSVLYHDVQLSWADPFKVTGLKLEAGVNNVFGTNPPLCFTCTLNGYDAGTYDLPGAFWDVRAIYKF